jgi:hypothetical protein
MSYIGHETVVSFINDVWEPNIIDATMATEIKVLLNLFDFVNTFITYVKDDGSNLTTLTCTLTYVISSFPLQLPCPFVGFFFIYDMSKVAQYATNYVKVCSRFIKINLNGVQISIHKTITWAKKFRK